MEYVKSFNAELSALYEVKPPISKAKMTAITRGAIKAIKFYKHVVQSVEKFILKCKSEYKVPGLYVIDSIVRQSRHQFGCDKDVFAPRFSKNIQQTFLNLFKCPPEDKSKIIRVLNLWQKNQVFPPEVIQPLFDLADPNNPIHEKLSQQIGTPIQSNGLNAAGGNVVKGSPALQKTPTKNSQGNDGNHHSQSSLNLSDPNVLAQLQQLQRLLTRDSSSKTEGQSVHFDKKLLDFDYGDEEEEVNPSPKPNPNDSVSNLLTNPEVLRQLQTLQQSLIASQAASEMDTEKMRKLHEMKLQEDEFDKHLAQTVPTLSFAAECDFKPTPPSALGNLMPNAVDNNSYYIPGSDLSLSSNYMIMPPQNSDNDVEFIGGGMNMSVSAERNNSSADIEVINLDHGDSRSSSPRDDRYNRRHRSRSRSRDRREKDRDRRSRRSRSRSGSRSRSRRHRSRSRERDRERAKEKERETEREKERKKRGLPPIKKEHLSICSTTLWVGHLSKFVHQEDLSDTFGEFGEIVSIDLIPPRGCAFIVMNRRQDAARCLVKLKNHNLHGKAITLAWAPGKGVKGKDLKDYWEGDLGVSYIPWNKLKPDLDLELLEDGGMLDEDTMPAWMKTKISQTQRKVDDSGAGLLALAATPSISGSVDTSQPPPLHGAGLIQPPPPMSMTLVPPPFQINRGLLAPPVGINLPHGMMTNVNMTNVPLGVPPPNMPTTMMSLGLGSPFQGPPGLLPPPHMTMHGDKGAVNSTPASMKSLSESLMNIANQSFGLPMTASVASSNQEDNMDVEMEEVDGKVEREMQGIVERQTGGDSMDDEGRDRREDRDRRSGGRERDRSRERGDRGERNRRNSRDRGDRFRDNRAGRDRDRNRRDFREDRRDRDGRDPKENRRGKEGEMGRGRERNQDRSRSQEDRGSSRGRDRRDRKGSDSRWGENKDRHDGPPDENDRMEREKSLNDRLQEMAHGPGDRKDHPRDQKDPEQDEALFSRFEPPPGFEQESPWKPPSELDNQDQSQHSPNMPLHDIQHMPFEGQINSGPPNPVMMDSFISSHGMMGGMDQPPMDDFRPVGLPMDGPPMDGPHGARGSFNAPPHGFMGAGPFEGPPLINGPPGMEPYFNGRGRGRGRGNFRGNFGPRMRGNGREFFPPRDDFFPRGMPGPRGGPRMMRPGFFPRGGMAGPGPGPGPRGMRGGPHWRDRGGSMRFEPPHYFDGPPGMNEGPSNMYNDEPQDRFDRPPDIYNETPEMFDGPPRRGPRFGRGGVKHGFDEGPEGMGRPDKRSRWGNFDDQREEYERLQREHEMSQGEGNTTPLRDEQPDMMHGQGESTEKEVKEDYREFQEAEPNYEEGYSQPGQDDVPPPSEVQESFNVPEEPVSVEENRGDVGDGAGVDTGAVDGATDVTEDKTEPVE